MNISAEAPRGRAGNRRQPWIAGAVVLLGLLTLILTSPDHAANVPPVQRVAGSVIIVVMTLAALVQWRRFRLGTVMIVLCLALLAAIGAVQYLGLAYVVVCWQVWVLAQRIERRRGWVLGGIVVASLVGQWLMLLVQAALSGDIRDYFLNPSGNIDETLLMMAVFTCISIGFFWMLGNASRRRHLRYADLKARAELAALTERSRIAREMHDIVAHSLTAVIAQADGGRFAAKEHPEMATEALASIAQESRRALAEMRSLLSVLHEEDRSQDIAPGSEQVAMLVKEAERNGLRIDFTQTGTPRQLSEAKSLTLYRIVQECITNALKHAGSVEATLHIDWEDRITVTMENAPGQGLGGLPQDFGRGLIGIRERARIHGGDARWGTSKSYPGGWKVQAWMVA